uniref:Cysteine and histidine-rich domain-containing protein 1-like n=1 Tax=Phallusia mammillata TaxID=59560 RepID=A0A6F9D8P7_9ASCI|nr:cysteine and histidine-rich domain-containing protein 1-like [Phallusia mammillata]
MAVDPVLLQCYNKSCGAKFNPTQNSSDSCQYHPGMPVFHDALKGWSCCKKRTTDFTDFLKIPGCTIGEHNPEKPKEEIKPKVEEENKEKKIEVKQSPPEPKPKVPVERPSENEPLQMLSIKTTSSYNKSKVIKVAEEESGEIKVGTSCRNSGCKATYENGPSDKTSCVFHCGTAVFHEGMKYWSCCKRKTSDFTSFLNQEGCSKGVHLWKKPKEEKTTCRYDWHQTGPNVVLSVFAKLVDVDKSTFQANQVVFKAGINFESGKHFDLHLRLFGIVDPNRSKVTVSGTKVEVVLYKSVAMHWKKIGEVIEEVKENVEVELKEVPVPDNNSTKNCDDNESSDSDLDGIDDVIFD